ncbi:MAG TPA: transglycosylase family protein [Kribbella sp.]|nr:transglycosylase family protein [Kribbella sp.]
MARTISIAGLGAGITAVGTASAFAADYTVKPGDTLSQIAQANGTDWHQLAKANNLQNPNLILIGQTLTLDGVKSSAGQDQAPRVTPKSESYNSDSNKSDSNRSATRKSDSNRSTRSADRPQASNGGGGKASLSGAWAKVANCESSGNPHAVNGGGYYGLFQFDLQTWRSVGGSGNPTSASAGEQLMRAKKLYSQRGASPWPVCGRFLR